MRYNSVGALVDEETSSKGQSAITNLQLLRFSLDWWTKNQDIDFVEELKIICKKLLSWIDTIEERFEWWNIFGLKIESYSYKIPPMMLQTYSRKNAD